MSSFVILAMIRIIYRYLKKVQWGNLEELTFIMIVRRSFPYLFPDQIWFIIDNKEMIFWPINLKSRTVNELKILSWEAAAVNFLPNRFNPDSAVYKRWKIQKMISCFWRVSIERTYSESEMKAKRKMVAQNGTWFLHTIAGFTMTHIGEIWISSTKSVNETINIFVQNIHTV